MIQPLLRTIARFYRQRREPDRFPMLAPVVDALASTTPLGPRRAETKPVTRHLDSIGDTGDPLVDDVLREFVAIAALLPWSQTAGYLDVLSTDYLDNYGYVQLVGPGAPVENDELRVGIGLWGPGLHYPMHAHEAEELYHVLHGEPEFRTATSPWRRHAVGDAVHHAPQVAHAQRFGAEPTLLLYAWTGEVHTDAALVDSRSG